MDGDILVGGLGNDTIYGYAENEARGTGRDVAVFSGSITQYDFNLPSSKPGWMTVSGPDGFDWIRSLDDFQFDDGKFTKQQIIDFWL